jgi:hypothetical protein
MKTITVLLIVFLACLNLYAATVEISWKPNSESDLAGYKVYYGTTSGQYGAPIDVGNITVYTMTISPIHGGLHYFALTAYDTSGNESGKSEEVSVFIPDLTSPQTPGQIIIIIRP